MTRATTLFTDTEKNEIRSALIAAEQHTSGEIVPVVATASGRYDRAEDLFGLLFATVLVIVVWSLFQGSATSPTEWQSGPELIIGLLPLILLYALGFIAGVALSTWVPSLKYPFVARQEFQEEVDHRAAECFYRYEIGKTRGGTGILIYVSLFEHLVTVKGDHAISKELSAEQWQEVCDAIIEGLKQGNACQAVKNGIRFAGELLSEAFPGEADDVDELPNTLHLID